MHIYEAHSEDPHTNTHAFLPSLLNRHVQSWFLLEQGSAKMFELERPAKESVISPADSRWQPQSCRLLVGAILQNYKTNFGGHRCDVMMRLYEK